MVGSPRYGNFSPWTKLYFGILDFLSLIFVRDFFIHSDFSLRNFSIRQLDIDFGARMITPFSGWIWIIIERRRFAERIMIGVIWIGAAGWHIVVILVNIEGLVLRLISL